ncbi:MAG: Molybdopterin molybdenumtransferase [Bacteroidetes bacterium ADurb.Bin408]|nr:MAG: Molybdopterin molybdenumtransferase [Bacteroidetes bacterium ADurb.Bin408]
MISFDEALRIINSHVLIKEPEIIDIRNAYNRVLAKDVVSDINVPPFNKSAMDGFAIRRQDLRNELTIIETIKAGDLPTKKLQQNECAQIMTGAPLPDGADCVIMVEMTENIGFNKIRFTGTDTKNNISLMAEDIKQGDIVLKKGTLLRPQELAILATSGCSKPLVYRLPKVALLTTGSEIVEPDMIPDKGKIRNSNAYQLIGQLQSIGIEPDYMGIVEDSEEATYRAITDALKKNDVVLMTGGISMGDYDFVPSVLKRAGVNILVHSIAIKPGKPTLFGKKDKAFIFGLPGNPVSSFTTFELFAKPFIQAMSGHPVRTNDMVGTLKNDFKQKHSDRMTWLPVFIDENHEVNMLKYHGSAHIYALCYANALMRIEAGVSEIKAGEKVYVRQI